MYIYISFTIDLVLNARFLMQSVDYPGEIGEINIFISQRLFSKSMLKAGKRELCCLLVIFATAYMIRGVPSWFNWGWGNDFGIYYGLSQALVENPQLFRPYTGWGQTYNYFPMLYIIMVGLHALTGIEIPVLLRLVSPIIGSLSVVFFYFVAKEMGMRTPLPFLIAMLLAVNPFHAYQTAHAAPLTIGHFFLALTLYLFLRKDRSTWATHALYLSTILLIMSHHLSTFVFIVGMVGIVFFRGLESRERPPRQWTDVIYIVFLSAITFGYWALIATPVFKGFIPQGLYFSPYVIVLLFYAGIGCMLAGLELKYRSNHEYRPKIFGPGMERTLGALVFLLFAVAVGLMSLVDVGTGFVFLPVALPLLMPALILLALAVTGLNRVDREDYGPGVKGLFYPFLLVFVFSLVTWNPVLLPFRFLEYLAYPLSILSGLGIGYLVKEIGPDWMKLAAVKRYAVFGLAALIVLSGATTYAVQRSTSRYEESISSQVDLALDYLVRTATGNSTVASDHRICNSLWQRQAEFNLTYDGAYHIWSAIGWDNQSCLRELGGSGYDGSSYGTVDYLVIDSVMVRNGIQSNINRTPMGINATSYEKFNRPPFDLVFESTSREKLEGSPWGGEGGTVDEGLTVPLPDALNWCRVYRVNWTYIQGHGVDGIGG